METLKYPVETKAISEHRCDFCNGRISKGETYLKSTHKADGSVYDWKTHKYCAELADRLKMYEDAQDGLTQEAFMEIVSERYNDMLINQFPKEEIKKYSDVIQQLRYVNWRDKFSYVLRHYNKP